jgi:hypothetical protein
MYRITLALLLLFIATVTITAQQGVNYKALIKDDNNAVVANRMVTVQFIIYKSVGLTNNVYQETHTPTTDANGIIIISIGQGTMGITGVFDGVDWASDAHFLNTQINTGSGLVDMGTISFSAVPYAFSAKTSEKVLGLEASGIGTTSPDASSVLDVFSESKGFLMPRLTTVQRDAITLPANGLMIYNSTINDGQINIGTSSAPRWVGIKEPDSIIASVTEGDVVSTSSTDDLLVPGMTLSPSSGAYLTLFNAMMFNDPVFSSDQGVSDVDTLYDDLMAVGGSVAHNIVFGNDETLSPGVYDAIGALSINGNLTRDGDGDPNSVFIIRGTGAFTTGANAVVNLINGASANNIFWVSEGAMSTGAPTTIKGTLVAHSTAIALGANTDLEGRVFSTLGELTMGAGSSLSLPSGVSSFDLGVLSSFVMFTASGAISGCETCTITGDAGTGLGAVTALSGIMGNVYPAGTAALEPSATTYSIYQNGLEVLNSSRTINLQSSVVNLQTMVTVASGDTIEIRWKVDTGAATLNHRALSMIRSGN